MALAHLLMDVLDKYKVSFSGKIMALPHADKAVK